MSVGVQKLHPQGPELSRLSWGMMLILQSDETRDIGKLAQMIDACLEMGITTFDHADIYGGYRVEAHFGEALKKWGGARTRLQLVTKSDIRMVTETRPEHRIKHYDTSREYILEAVDRSLAHFGTDYLDLFLVHRPDPLVDVDELAEALDRVVAAGKVLYIGVSNHTPDQFEALQSRLHRPLVTNQIQMSVLYTDPLFDGSLDHARLRRYSPMIWSPLAGRSLFRGEGERERRVRGALQAVAEQIGGVDIAQVALAWLLRHPTRPLPVLGTGKVERLREFVRATEINLDRQQWFSILEASEGREVP